MGDPKGHGDERPRRERIADPFWIGTFEVTNRQFAQFDPAHDSRYIRTHGIVSTRGYPAWRKVYNVSFRVVCQAAENRH